MFCHYSITQFPRFNWHRISNGAGGADLLHWLLKRDDCYQSHRDSNRCSHLVCFSSIPIHIWNVICAFELEMLRWIRCHSIYSKLIEILQPDTQLTWLSNTFRTHHNPLAFAWIQCLLSVCYWGNTQYACAMHLYLHTLFYRSCSRLTCHDGLLFIVLIFPMSFRSSSATGSHIRNSTEKILKVSIEMEPAHFWLLPSEAPKNFSTLSHAVLTVFVHRFNRIHLYQLANVKSMGPRNLEHQTPLSARCVFAWCSIVSIHKMMRLCSEHSLFSNISFILIHVK